MAEWVINELIGNRSVRGGSASRHVVGGFLDTLVREAGQNIVDQRPDGFSSAITARFTLLSLQGDRKKRFLDALDWARLRHHLEAADIAGGGVVPQLQRGIHDFDNNRKEIVCLRIDDGHTNGLVGGEFDNRENFALLCRDEFVTPNRVGRGGSHGLGKGVLWRFSRTSTVVFSSRVASPRVGVRLFGRADIPSHKIGDTQYDYGGFFGNRKEPSPNDVYAESVWNDQRLSEDLCVDRADTDATGTTALIVGFFEPTLDQERDLTEIAGDIKTAAEKWFWPLLIGPNPQLQVEIRVDGRQKSFAIADPAQSRAPFIRAFRDPATVAKVKGAGEIAEKAIPLQIPTRDQPDEHRHPQLSASGRLRVTRSQESEIDFDSANTIAFVRGHGMVIRYEKMPRKPLDDVPVFGVVKAGTLENEGTLGFHAEEFLRNAEPPLHDKWEITDALREQYQRGAGSSITRFIQAVQSAALALVDEDIERAEAGPRLLARHFPFGTTGTKKRRQAVRCVLHEAFFQEPLWLAKGKLEYLGDDGEDWRVTIGFVASGESGVGEPMAIDTLRLTDNAATHNIHNGKAEIRVHGAYNEIDFVAEVNPATGLSIRDQRRTAVEIRHSTFEPSR